MSNWRLEGDVVFDLPEQTVNGAVRFLESGFDLRALLELLLELVDAGEQLAEVLTRLLDGIANEVGGDQDPGGTKVRGIIKLNIR